jgi:hypothetical protein
MAKSKMHRKFDGKLYALEAIAWSKREAQNRAKQFRKDGFLVRVVKAPSADNFSASGEGWAIYTRMDHTRVRR